MKRKSKGAEADDLRPEYDLDTILKDGVQGKYAERYEGGTNLIVLAPDVAEVFPTDASVNAALRLVIRLRRLPSVPRKNKAKSLPQK